MKKGFTLIEVLGVIILLGLLALIVFPSVVNQMKKIDSNISESSKKIIYMAADEYIADNKNKYQDNFDYNSYIVVKLNMLVNNGYLSNNIDIKDYKYVKINIENGNSNSYTMLEDLEKHDLFDNGEVIYFNPTTGKKCSKNDYTTNLNNYSTTNTLSDGTKSPTGLKNGCMKWYAFNDNIDNGLVNLILDHNTSGNVAWNSGNSNKKMNEVAIRLKSDTNSWSDSIILNKKIDNFDYAGYKARLITADEVAQITGAAEVLEWSSSKLVQCPAVIGSSICIFYFDGADGTNATWQSQVVNKKGASKFGWLFENLYLCTSYGCNIEDNNTYSYGTENSTNKNYIYSYWTSTSVNNTSTNIWRVYRDGSLGRGGAVTSTSEHGVRPVIMVNKEIFE